MKKFLLISLTVLTAGLAHSQIVDGGFEAGDGSGSWTEASTNFGTPICSVAICGDCGGGCVPNTGDFYLWFGGAAAVETGSVEQSVTFPTATTASIDLQLVIPPAGSGLTEDVLEVSVDGTVLGTVTAADSLAYAVYTTFSVDASAYADGAAHAVRVEGFQTTDIITNFIVDDVVLTSDGGSTNSLFKVEKDASLFSVYPNPANEEINLNFSDLSGSVSVSIVNVNGSVISQEELSDVLGKTFTFSTAAMNNGVYFVTVVSNGSTSTSRIVVTK